MAAVNAQQAEGENEVREQHETQADANNGKTRWEMLREPRFYMLLPAAMAPSFIMTAMFFHHLTLAEAKGWSAEWVTGSYWIFGLSTVLALLTAGPLIDRLTAARIMPFYLLPLAAGLILLAPASDPLDVAFAPAPDESVSGLKFETEQGAVSIVG